jgi:aldose sugar dehydrogenase
MMRFFILGFLATSCLTSYVHAQGVERLYATNCANCHGKNGQGGGAGTRTLHTDELRNQDLDRRFFDATKNGIEGTAMPGFGATMSDQQVWALVNHVRHLQHAAYREVGGRPMEARGAVSTKHHKYKMETLVSRGLDTPWSVDFLPTGEMLITERDGDLRVWSNGKLSKAVASTPKVLNKGQGGLMDVAVHPDYAKNGLVFLSFSDAAKDKPSNGMTKVVRGKLKATGDEWIWTDQFTVFEAKQEHYVRSDIHFGCRIVFDPKDSNILYFCIGERGMGMPAQNLGLPHGKIHRVTIDGQTPRDNPIVGKGDTYETIWSFGHRNPQGMVFDLEGNLWDTEHGPRGGDELNLIRKGRNYGWPLVSYGIEYSGAALSVPWPEMVPAVRGTEIVLPAHRWIPSTAACGLDVVRPGPKGEAFPGWKGDLLSGGLAGQSIDRVRMKVNADGSTQVVEHEEILFEKGRVRDVVCGPEGAIYVVLNDPHHVVRLVPVSQ